MTDRSKSFAMDNSSDPIKLLDQTRQQLLVCESRFLAILEQTSEAVLIFDSDHKIRFVNSATAILFNCETDDLIGQAIPFPVLIGQTIERELVSPNVWVMIHTQPIEWDRKPAFLAMLKDINKEKQLVTDLNHRISLEKLISEISSHLINTESDHLDTNILHALEKLGQFLDVEHCYACFLSNDHNSIDHRLEWNRSNDQLFVPEWKDISLRPFHWSMDRFQHFEPVQFSSLSELPPAAGAEKSFYLSHGIETLVEIPMVIGKTLVGYMGFASSTQRILWGQEDIRLLRLLGDFIARALKSRQMEHAMLTSEAQFQAVFEHSGIGIAISDLEGRIVQGNPAFEEMVGYSSQELHQMHPAEFTHPADLEKDHEAIRGLTAGEYQRYQIEKRYIHQDGHAVGVRETGSFVYNADKKPVFYIGMVENITERKQAEESLKQHDAILEAVIYAAENFLRAGTWEGSIQGMVEQMGKATNASRIYISEIHENNGMRMNILRYEWIDPNAPPQMKKFHPKLDSFSQIGLTRWETLLAQNLVVHGMVKDFPPLEQTYFTNQNIRSVITVPIFISKVWWGFISLETCQIDRAWSNIEVDAFKAAASILGAAIQHKRTEEEVARLYHTERQQRELAETLHGVGNILSTILDVETVFDRLLDQVAKVVPYDTASLLLIKNGKTYVARNRGHEKYGAAVAQFVEKLEYDILGVANFRKMVETGQPLIISDTEQYPGWIKYQELSHIRSWAGAPIILQRETIGFFSLDKVRAGFYKPDHADRLSAFAGQAALALQNAWLFAETRQTLEHEQRLNEIAHTISSTLELPEVLRHILRLGTEIVGADASILTLLDPEGEIQPQPYTYNLPKGSTVGPLIRDNGLTRQIIDSGKSILLADYAQHPKAAGWLVSAQMHGFIGVPVIAGKSCMGSLGLFSTDKEKVFTQRDVALAESIGHQAGVAIQNAQLFKAAERRAEEAETLRQATATITGALDLNQVLERILDQLNRVVPHDSAAIFLLEEGNLRIVAARGFEQLDELLNQTFSADDPLFGLGSTSRKATILKDASADPRFHNWGKSTPVRGWIGVPLIVRGEVIGHLTADSNQSDAYSQTDADMTQAFANQAAVAIENARLFEKIQQLAITDHLTGINNRRHFFEQIRVEFERAQRYKHPMSVILIDLDNFKRVNDTYGHLVGDQALKKVSQCLNESLRSIDMLARYGGDEFVVLLPETNTLDALEIGERLRLAVVDESLLTDVGSIQIQLSLGIASLDESCHRVEDLLEHADQALYAAKQRGKNQVFSWPL